MLYRIYYADGSTYDSNQGKPWEAPGLGVLVIVQEHRIQGERAYLQHMADYYVWKDNRWQGCDLFYIWQYLLVNRTDFPKAVLAGETVINDIYTKAVCMAKDDPDFQGVTG